MSINLTFIVLSLLMLACENGIPGDSESEHEVAYYSDYYVFISEDSASPLIVPLDLNWNSAENGYEIEFKAWHGTENDWPINYTTKSLPSSNAEIPKESFEHANIDAYQFDSSKREITLGIQSAPEIKFSIPDKEEWVLGPSDGKEFRQTFAAKSNVEINNQTIPGWILYERIRLTQEDIVDFGDFETFFWLPILVDGRLYHFEQHKGEKFAMTWFDDGISIVSEEVKNFELAILTTVIDSPSGRNEIPKTIQILSEVNNLEITLGSTGEQVGYGEEFPKGLAFYRQSLLQSTTNSGQSGYGMMELIIENN